MSRHEIGTSRSGSVVANGEIRVPLDQDGFRRDRNRTSIAATMGVTMTLGFCGFPALLLYMWVTDPAERNTTLAIVGAALSLVLLLIISAATWPAMQTANLLTKTLKERLPALIVNRDGIQDYSSNSVFGFIPWSQIEAVLATSRYSNRLNQDFPGVAFVVKDRNFLLRRRLGLTGSRLSDYPPTAERRQIFIPQGRIGVPVENVVSQINAFRAGLIP